MAYTKTVWKDRVVEKPRNYTITNNADGSITLTPAPGVVTEAGTPIIAANLNNMEHGITDILTQLASKAAKPTYSVASTGWEKDQDSGRIRQWGYCEVAITSGVFRTTQALPISFTSDWYYCKANVYAIDNSNNSIDMFTCSAGMVNNAILITGRNVVSSTGSVARLCWEVVGK